MTILVHVVGPQGSGKSTLIRDIVATAPERLVACDWEAAQEFGHARIRDLNRRADVVFVEALELEPRHSDLAPGDVVLTLRVRDAA